MVGNTMVANGPLSNVMSDLANALYVAMSGKCNARFAIPSTQMLVFYYFCSTQR